MTVGVRYIVDDVDKAIEFYTQRLGFELEMHPAPGFARLRRGDLALMLNAPGAGGAGQSSSAGDVPSPGGWARFQLEVRDLDAVVNDLKSNGGRIRTDIVQGNGGRQAIIEDPAGNAVELMEPQQR